GFARNQTDRSGMNTGGCGQLHGGILSLRQRDIVLAGHLDDESASSAAPRYGQATVAQRADELQLHTCQGELHYAVGERRLEAMQSVPAQAWLLIGRVIGYHGDRTRQVRTQARQDVEIVMVTLSHLGA